MDLTAYVHRRWTQEYRGVSVEIAHWGKPDEPEYYTEEGLRGEPKGMCDGHGMWNYYLLLTERLFTPEEFEKLWLPPQGPADDKGWVSYDYYVWPFTELDMHGGITFYEKKGGHDGGNRLVKIGCDYGHLWDRERGYQYDKNWVWHDAKASVDCLHRLYPNLKRRCQYNGNFYEQSEMIEVKPGVWYSREGKEASDKWRAEYDARKSA